MPGFLASFVPQVLVDLLGRAGIRFLTQRGHVQRLVYGRMGLARPRQRHRNGVI